MNTRLPLNRSHGLLAATTLLAVLATATPVFAQNAAPAPTAPAPSTETKIPAKPYALFMGNDVAIAHGKEFFKIINVVGSDMMIKIKGETKIISRQDLKDFKLDYSLKLSHLAVQIDGLTVERSFTPANDPGRKFVEQAINNAAMQDAGEKETIRNAKAQAAAEAATNAAAITGGSGPGAAAQQQAAQQNAAALRADANSARLGPVGSGLRTGTTLDIESFDAIDVSFKITAPRLLEKPYLVMIAEYKLADDKPNESHKFLYARNLEAIGIAPVEVSFKAGGLPAGFVITKKELHIYQNTRELATNLSEKRVDMTRENAYTYTLINYLSEHKKDTLPVSALLMPNPEERKVRISRAKLYDPLFVRVDPKGKIIAISMDAAGKIEPKVELVEALRDFVFLPALEKGTAVEGTCTLRMLDYL